MTYLTEPCDIGTCRALHGVRVVPASKRGPARPYDGPYVSPLRSRSPVGDPPPRLAGGSIHADLAGG